MSLGHPDDLEVRSVLAGSSCSGHEIQSGSDDDDCSQSEISLYNDGASEDDDGDADQDGSSGREDLDSQAGATIKVSSEASYDCCCEEACSQRHAKGNERKLGSPLESSKMSLDADDDASETAWNFNDFIEFVE